MPTNYKAEVDQLNREGKKILMLKESRLIRIPGEEKGKKIFKFFLIDKRPGKHIGKGSFGEVCRASEIDPSTGEIINTKNPKTGEVLPKVHAVKIINLNRQDIHINEDDVHREAEILAKYYSTEKPFKVGSNIYLVTEYLPGQELSQASKVNSVEELNDDIKKLNFAERTELLFQLALSFNLIHHSTPRTGSALIHADIKGPNIKVFVNHATKKMDVYPLDFGLSDPVRDDPAFTEFRVSKGTLNFIAKEVMAGWTGIKTDIYALTPVCALVAGATDPLSDKARVKDPAAKVNQPFNLNGIFKGMEDEISQYPSQLPDLVKKFLYRMQSPEYDQRPDSDEFLRFLTSWNNICKLYQFKQPGELPDEALVKADLAKMVLLSSNNWYTPLGKQPLERITRSGKTQSTNIERIATFEQLDFEAHPEVVNAILDYADTKNMSKENMVTLAKKAFESDVKERAQIAVTQRQHQFYKPIHELVETLNIKNFRFNYLASESQDAKNLLDRYELIDQKSKDKLTKVLNITQKYLPITMNLLTKIIKENNIDLGQALKVSLQGYIQRRSHLGSQNKYEGKYLSFFGKHFGYSREEKINTVNKIIDIIDKKEQVELNARDLDIIHDGNLGKIIKDFEKLNLLPKEIEQASNREALKNTRMMR